MARALVWLVLSCLLTAASALHMQAESHLDAENPRSFRSWEEAKDLATRVSAKMTEEERKSLMIGIGFGMGGPALGYYVGTTSAIPRLDVPALKMQDASGGFRTTHPGTDGTTTAWPSMLALASTWDGPLVKKVAGAIAQEFKGKGANVLLGPGLNVQRNADNGRSFEYLSGDDPYLAARLAYEYVTGVQEQGVIAVPKHFAFNQQETSRNSISAELDDRTAWELYFPPWQAAVDAGAASIMCSYNKINGTWACENENLLKRDLREKMGFKGFVMSDWWATKSDSRSKGLDQEMPGELTLSGTKLNPMAESSIFKMAKDSTSYAGQKARENAAINVLTSIYRLRLDEHPGCTPPQCQAELKTDQTSDAHHALAREAATDAVTLLQNDGTLPLKPGTVKSIAILGSAANGALGNPGVSGGNFPDGDFYSGGGSGHVVAGKKRLITARRGIEQRAKEAGMQVYFPEANSKEAAIAAARKADVVLVVGGATSKESVDRESLSLADDADSLIFAVQGLKPTVVLMQTPGVVLTPWREGCAAVMNLPLAGEATGEAWAAVLFGDKPPTGKLPMLFPRSRDDIIPTEKEAQFVKYAEGLFTSYRDPHHSAYPFGHGLSYTTWKYSEARKMQDGCSGRACIAITVHNTGTSPGKEIAQAYVHFPNADLQTPDHMLRAFHKTKMLESGEGEEAVFTFTDRDLSTYSPEHGWMLQEKVEFLIGSSSEQILARITLEGLN